MAPQSSVNRQQMQVAATKVADAHGQMGQVKNRLTGHHGELQAAWKGESAAAFTQVFQLFQTEFTKVIKDLDLIHQKLIDTRVKYETAEQEKTGRINQLRGMVNG